MTNNRLHNLDGKKIKRSIPINKIKALVKNIKDDNKDEFLVQVQGQYDYRFKSDDRGVLFKLINA